MRAPKRSRIRSESPFPDTTPIRAHISWMIIRAAVIGMRVHSRVRPYSAPARE
jgi:hypothetical protein